MTHQTLYRKWRPQLFSQIIGQGHVTETLSRAIDTHRLSHAYLFSGPRGTGKTTTARILAKAIDCVNGPTSTPCGVCDACVGISDGSYLDLIEIDAASHRRVEETRNVLETIPLSPAHGRKKVYIIDEVHMLTNESSNTLLKTLEEPPDHVIFVLATTDPQDVLSTIQSRCQRFDFRSVDAVTLAAHLRLIAEDEGIHADDESLLHIARSHGGSVRDAIGTLEQLWMFCPTGITSHDVSVMLGTTELGVIFEASDILESGTSAEAIGFMRRLSSRGTDLRHFLQDLCRHYRDLLLLSESPAAEHLIETSSDRRGELAKQASAITPRRALDVARRVQQAILDVRDSTDPLLTIEILMLDMLARNAVSTATPMQTPATVKEPAPAARPAQASSPAATDRPVAAVPPPVPAAAPRPATVPSTPPAASSWSGDPGQVKDLASLDAAWPAVIEMLRQMNRMSTSAYLRMARLVGFEDGTVTIAFRFDNHMKRMESSDNKEALQKVIQDRIIGGPVTLRFVVDSAAFDGPPPMNGAAQYMDPAVADPPIMEQAPPTQDIWEEPAQTPDLRDQVTASAEIEVTAIDSGTPATPGATSVPGDTAHSAPHALGSPATESGSAQQAPASSDETNGILSLLIDSYGAMPADHIEVEFPAKPVKNPPPRPSKYRRERG